MREPSGGPHVYRRGGGSRTDKSKATPCQPRDSANAGEARQLGRSRSCPPPSVSAPRRGPARAEREKAGEQREPAQRARIEPPRRGGATPGAPAKAASAAERNARGTLSRAGGASGGPAAGRPTATGRSGSDSARGAEGAEGRTARRGRRSAAERRASAATAKRIATREHTALVARERSGGQQPGRVAERGEAPRVPGPGPAPCRGRKRSRGNPGGRARSARGGEGLRHSPPPRCSLFIVHGRARFPRPRRSRTAPGGGRKRGVLTKQRPSGRLVADGNSANCYHQYNAR